MEIHSVFLVVLKGCGDRRGLCEVAIFNCKTFLRPFVMPETMIHGAGDQMVWFKACVKRSILS